VLPPPSPTQGTDSALLRVARLRVTYVDGGQSYSPALRHVDLTIAAREVVGILGESGCGKSTLARAILGLLPRNARVEGSVQLRGVNLIGLPEPGLRCIRGAKISLIHQEPGLSLSPVMRIGQQIAEVIRAHRRLGRNELRNEVERMLSEVRLSDPRRISHSYPHQLSGGELSRVVIAQALACRPDLVIADEPTRSLDVRVQAEILDLLRELNHEVGTAILFITHNPTLFLRFADRVVVMSDGEVVEEGSLSLVFRQPRHPYTQSLLRLVPNAFAGAASWQKDTELGCTAL